MRDARCAMHDARCAMRLRNSPSGASRIAHRSIALLPHSFFGDATAGFSCVTVVRSGSGGRPIVAR